MPLLDHHCCVIGICAGKPPGTVFLAAIERLTSLLEAAQASGQFLEAQQDHSQGKFAYLAWGFSHGGGRKKPQNLNKPRSKNFALVEGLMRDDAFRMLANHVSSIFETWALKFYSYYQENKRAICTHYPLLEPNWPGSVFTAIVLNLKPQTVTYWHKDFINLPFGWCSVTALGSFDPTRGGHLILWNLGLVIEFPPGFTILVPSAAIEHSNVAIGKDEKRCFITQYTAGALLCWADHGMKTEEEFMEGLSREEREGVAAQDAQRWRFGLSLLLTMEELLLLGLVHK
ncbi:hypothetical protein DXG01_013652 [Tephrocybe rancida]|nr:hypothetical protein DXG01_013652 [Tephrocybe rancida]